MIPPCGGSIPPAPARFFCDQTIFLVDRVSDACRRPQLGRVANRANIWPLSLRETLTVKHDHDDLRSRTLLRRWRHLARPRRFAAGGCPTARAARPIQWPAACSTILPTRSPRWQSSPMTALSSTIHRGNAPRARQIDGSCRLHCEAPRRPRRVRWQTRESAALAWRALALLQEELEVEFGLPMPRAARWASGGLADRYTKDCKKSVDL